jgi:hypothetical protein
MGDGSVASGNVAMTVPGADARATLNPLAVMADPPSLVYVPESVAPDGQIADTVDVPAPHITGAVAAGIFPNNADTLSRVTVFPSIAESPVPHIVTRRSSNPRVSA